MLKIKTRLLRQPRKTNGLIRDHIHAANEAAKRVAAIMREQCRDDGCDYHTDEHSIVTVVAQWSGHARIEKTEFCCRVFEQRYGFSGDGRNVTVRDDEQLVDDEFDPDLSELWLFPELVETLRAAKRQP